MNTLTRTPAELTQESSEEKRPPAGAAPRASSALVSGDPVCREVPVRVYGFLGTGGTESFTEDTQTLILFPSGAVVRLAAAVQQGQEIMLTNVNSKQQVHCRVSSVRASETARGYVELEFTHRKAGFWGSAPVAVRPSAAAAEPVNLPAISGGQPRAAAQVSAPAAPAIQPIPLAANAAVLFAKPPVATVAEVEIKLTAKAPSAGVAANDFANFEAPLRAPRPAESFAGPKLDPKNLIASDLQTGRKWVLLGASIAAGALAIVGGVFFFSSRPAPVSAVSAQENPVIAQSATTNVSPQVIEVRSDAAPADSSAAPRANDATRSATPLAAANQTATDSPVASASAPAKSGGIREAFHNVAVKLHLSPGAGKLIVPAAVQTPAANSANEPLALSANDPGASSPDGPATGAAAGIIGGGAPAIAPPPAPVLPLGGQASPPRAISTTAPNYPLAAKAAHIVGDVTIQTEIDATGKVAHMKVISGPALLQMAALNALQQWKYEPSKLNGVAVAGQMMVTLKFRLP